jgi:hypothetical protein
VYSLEVFFLTEVVKIFSQINISVVLQSQIIQKHLHVHYTIFVKYKKKANLIFTCIDGNC